MAATCARIALWVGDGGEAWSWRWGFGWGGRDVFPTWISAARLISWLPLRSGEWGGEGLGKGEGSKRPLSQCVDLVPHQRHPCVFASPTAPPTGAHTWSTHPPPSASGTDVSTHPARSFSVWPPPLLPPLPPQTVPTPHTCLHPLLQGNQSRTAAAALRSLVPTFCANNYSSVHHSLKCIPELSRIARFRKFEIENIEGFRISEEF